MLRTRKEIGVLGMAALFLPALGWGVAPERHPRYAQARADLRTALLLLKARDEPKVKRRIDAAEREIETAIREINHAAVIDREDTIDNPRTDEHLDRPGRFRKVMSLLTSARRDITREEDNPRAIAWRDGASHGIDKAMEELRKAARELQIDHLEGS
jgi:hypothetical protein